MSTDLVPGTPKISAPYTSFTTVMKVVNRVAEEGAPGVIDRSYLGAMSNGYKTQVLASLRALGLINETGAPTVGLLDIVAKRSTFGGFLQSRLQFMYPTAFEISATNGTTGQLMNAFRSEFGINGTTLEGAIRFFLDAARYAGVEVSPHFTTPSAVRTRKSPTRRKTTSTTPANDATVLPPLQPPRSYNVKLESGGTVMLSMSVDLFTLSETDREFVFSLVDDVRAYDKLRASLDKDSESQPPVSKTADS